MQLHASSGCMSEGADTSHFSGPWSEGHKSRERDISHCAFQEVHQSITPKEKNPHHFPCGVPPPPPPSTDDSLIFDNEKSMRRASECSHVGAVWTVVKLLEEPLAPPACFRDFAAGNRLIAAQGRHYHKWVGGGRCFLSVAWRSQVRRAHTIHLWSETLSNFYDKRIKVTCCLQA